MMRVTFLATLATTATTIVAAANFDYNAGKVRLQIRGVNLGGWLVLEQWMVPSIFTAANDDSVIDEWTFGQKTGSVGYARIQNHWQTWITEADFARIASYGLNHVRIPIGYWSIPGMKRSNEPYFVGAYDYLKQGVAWAQKYGINVIIDLHGVPGSQNGFDNSGHATPAQWHTSQDNYQRSIECVRQLTQDFVSGGKYGGAVTSIQPVNEPAGFLGSNVVDFVKRYHRDAYYTVRWPSPGVYNPSTLLSFSDAFMDPPYWQGNFNWPEFQSVALDNHYYAVFDDYHARLNDVGRIQDVCNRRDMYANAPLWTYVGEWSLGVNDCAGSHAVLGPNRGGSYFEANIGSCVGRSGKSSTWSNGYKALLRQYWEAQTNTFEAGKGWVYWAWKQELADEWSYSKLVEVGVIPQNPTERKYANACDTSALARQKSYSGANGIPFNQEQDGSFIGSATSSAAKITSTTITTAPSPTSKKGGLFQPKPLPTSTTVANLGKGLFRPIR